VSGRSASSETSGGPAGDGGRRASGPGRRPGESGTREAILRTARTAFSDLGYDRTTIRGIARDAHVDPSLVLHYFGSKANLFVAALQLPVDPGEVIARLVHSDDPADRDALGETIVRTFLSAWERPENREPFVAMVRSALTNATAQAMVREYLGGKVFGPITAALGVPDGQLRATLVGSQFIGLAIMRYVTRVEPIASAPPEQLVAALGPTVQRYLTGSLDNGSGRPDGTVTSRDGVGSGR
jgi:AcrR family transcriptional regulator